MSIRLFTPGVTASTETRMLRGPVVRYGVPGRTSRGRLRVRPGALYVAGDVSGVKLTKEHDLAASRGYAHEIEFLPDGIRAAMKAADDADGDDAIREALDKKRDGFSFHILDEVIEGDEIVSGRIIAIGQVGIPAYDDMRLDSIAASLHDPNNEGAPTMLTPEQRARLAELRANENRTPEEETEFAGLVALAVDEAASVTAGDPGDTAAAPAADAPTDTADAPAADAPTGVAAGMVPSVPSGIPLPPARQAARTQPQGENAFDRMISQMVQALKVRRAGGNPLPGITAALTDVTSSDHTSVIEEQAWSNELFSGVDYEPIFSGNLEPGPLNNWEGRGWRFTQTPAIQDYAGDKAEIPTGSVGTEESLWEAAIAAVGVDIDRKFYDFPNGEFLAGLFRAVAESVVIMRDTKSGLYITSEAVEVSRRVSVTLTNADATVTAADGAVTAADVGRSIVGTGIPAGTTVLSITNGTTFEMSANATATGAQTVDVGVDSSSLLKAAARLAQSLTRRYNGQKAPATAQSGPDYIYVNDEDWYGMLDITQFELPVYLTSYGITPETFIPTEDIPSGSLIGGVKRAAKLRTEANPIVIDALNIAHGGVDKAWHTYWAIEQQHKRGVQKAHFANVLEA